MAGRRSVSAGDAAWKHLIAVAGLLLAVGGTLVLGLVLEVDPEPAGAAVPAPAPGPRLDAVEPGAPPPEPEAAPLERRAAQDGSRLEQHRGRFTLQVLMACDPANVRPLLNRLPSDDSLFLVPKRYRDQDCFRVCWGLYDSADEARAARDLPATLAALSDAPQPTAVEHLLE